MASIASACRLSARAASRQVRGHGISKGFRTSARATAAHNFKMPALSPTMTEGNIASWKVKEGDSFSAGDVLLEVETDKAQMDVEAQDDGVMAKITQGDGSKAVKVGSRIAVLADPGDDIESLQIPEEDAAPQKSEESEDASSGQARRQDRPSPQSEMAGGLDPTESSPSAAEGPPSSKPNADAAAGGAADTAKPEKGEEKRESKSAGKSEGKPQKRNYPLLPSVEHLIHEQGISKEEVDKIPGSGPHGRLLKGDVLAYMGRIEKSYLTEQSKRLSKLGHLDLSNIKIKQLQKEAAPPKPTPAEAPPVLEPDTEVAVPVSLTAVLDCQKRIQDTLGIFLPLPTFIARAVEMANEGLPRSKTSKPSADELFNAVLGLDKVASAKTSRGNFVPQVTALPPAPFMPAKKSVASKKPDILDILAGKRTPSMPRRPLGAMAAPGVAPANVFSISVPKGDEKRAKVFLERVKTVLEAEPGRLVL